MVFMKAEGRFKLKCHGMALLPGHLSSIIKNTFMFLRSRKVKSVIFTNVLPSTDSVLVVSDEMKQECTS